LIEELSKIANFDYDIYLHHESYGGMVEELKNQVGMVW